MARPKLLDILKTGSNTTAYSKLKNNVSVTKSGTSLVVSEVSSVQDRATLVFKAPCNCTEVSSLQVAGVEYTLIDALTGNLGSISNIFAAGAIVVVALDTVDHTATVENAANNTNISDVVENSMSKSIYDPNADGVVEDSRKIGGSLPSVFMRAEDYTTDGIVNEASGGTGQNTFPYTYQPNLLINGDFKIWQRGQIFDNFTSGYTVDRWYVSAETAINVNRNSFGLSLSSAATLSYYMEMLDSISIFQKTVTLAYKLYNDDIVYTSTFAVNATTCPITVNGEEQTQRVVNLNFPSACTVEWVKLEIGNRFTGFSPRSYAAELADCQRYYQTGMYKTTGAFTYNGAWRYFHSHSFPVKMRVVPTLTATFLDVGYVATPPIANLSLVATVDCIHQAVFDGATGTASAKNNIVIEYIADAEIQP